MLHILYNYSIATRIVKRQHNDGDHQRYIVCIDPPAHGFAVS